MSAIDSLKSLHTSLIDAIKGYEKAVEDAASDAVQAIFEEMRTVHLQAHSEIDAILQSKGETPDEEGSFMAVVHKAVIAVRSATTGLDYSSMQENIADQATVGVLMRQRDRLQGMIGRLRGQGEAASS